MTIIIEINQEECAQCGNCKDECPEVFMEDENGNSEIVEEYRDGSPTRGRVPDELLDCVKRAIGACTVDSITVTQE